MGTPYSRPSTVRTTSLRDGGVVEREYNRVGLALAIFAALFFFVALWAVNGYFTARTVRAAGQLLGIAALSWGAGWLTHIVISLIEHHLWRLRETVSNAPRFVLLGVYCLIIFVGVLDVLTSALAFLLLFSSFGLSVTDPTVRFVSVVLAEVIAIIPEPLIVWLCVALWRVIRN
jgi:hypothetical protein